MTNAASTFISGLDLSIINTIILVFFLVFTVWELLHGLRRGIYRQILHTGFMLLSAFAAFMLTKSMWNEFFSYYPDMKSLLDEISIYYPIPLRLYNLAIEFDVNIVTTLLALPLGVFILPIIFSLSFAVINILGKVLCLIFRLIFGIKKGRGPIKRLTGLLLGAVEGALVASICLLPVVSITGIVKDAAPAIVDATAESDDAALIEGVVAVCDDPVLNLVESIGGDAILNSLSTVEIDGTKINLRKDASILAGTLLKNIDTVSTLKFSDLSEDDKQAIKSMLGDVLESDYISTSLSALISDFSEAVYTEDLPIELAPPYDTLLNDAVDIFRTTNKDNLHADLDTLLDVYFLIDESGVAKAIDGGDPIEALVTKDGNGKTFIARIIDTLELNNRMKLLVTSLTKISLNILSEQNGAIGNATEIYEKIKDEFNGGILETKREDYETEEEYKEALTEQVNDALAESNITLEPEIVEKIADYVDDEFIQNGVTSIDEAQFNDLILSYYDYYLEHQDEIDALPSLE